MNVILGTAGHIDHGKTSLIKALTGIDTDRLKEEKKRGITIEPGFAYLDLPCGNRMGIVDVPGHERFIHNMLCGANGIDIAMAVIAADEGIMPQTTEHLSILSLLEVKHGIVVITKTDLVDDDWLEMLTEEIRDRFKTSFLAGAPIIPVSAYSGRGLEELKHALSAMALKVEGKKTTTPFRLPIDRVFSVDGFGTVVTGTLTQGFIKEKQDVMLYPSLERAKVRSLQVHGEATQTAYAGQRVAVNISGIKKHAVIKGHCLAAVNSMKNTGLLDVKLKIPTDTERTVKNSCRVHLFHGTSQTLCKIILLDRDELKPGENGFAQLRLENPLAVKPGDPFVIRFYSPLETIGGGKVLDANPVKHKRNRPEVIKGLEIRESGTTKQKVMQVITEWSKHFKDVEFIKRSIGSENTDAELNELTLEKSIIRLNDNLFISAEYADSLQKMLVAALTEFHKLYPLKKGMNREEVRTKLAKKDKTEAADCLVNLFVGKKVIKSQEGFISLPNFKVTQNTSDNKIMAELEKIYIDAGFAPPLTEDAAKKYASCKQQFNGVLSLMKTSGILVDLDGQYCMHKVHCQKALDLLKDFIAKNGGITPSEYRELLGVTRKYAVALLEYFDKIKITKKLPDRRILS